MREQPIEPEYEPDAEHEFETAAPVEIGRLKLGDQLTREQVRELINRPRKRIEVNGPMVGVVDWAEELENRWVIYTRPADEERSA